MMRHGSLFSGIGGFDLASDWMGWENVFHCEWNEFGKRILKYYWPNAIGYDDIKKTDFTIHRGAIDILTGGFPCQPYSVAGKRKGKEDERHLWPEMLRAIREVQPHWVVGENVLGLINWNGGLVFNEVQADLEAAGYQVWPYVLPACAVNAPHKRERIWFVAYAKDGNDKRNEREFSKQDGRQELDYLSSSGKPGDRLCENGIITNANSEGSKKWIRPGRRSIFKKETTCEGSESSRAYPADQWGQFPTEAAICNGDDGLSARLDGITFSKWRNESIKGGGNAIVPQVVLQIFKAIEQYQNTNHHG